MPTGLFKRTDGSVQVDYDNISIPVPKTRYDAAGYKPDFDQLPLEADYTSAKEKQDHAKGG